MTGISPRGFLGAPVDVPVLVAPPAADDEMDVNVDAVDDNDDNIV